MSINLTLHFEDKKKRKIRTADLYQTPTDVTYHILKQKDKLQAYTEWVKKEVGEDEGPHCKYVENLIKEYGDDYTPVWSLI